MKMKQIVLYMNRTMIECIILGIMHTYSIIYVYESNVLLQVCCFLYIQVHVFYL